MSKGSCIPAILNERSACSVGVEVATAKGIFSLLRRLSKEKIPLAVATSTPTEQAERSLRIAGIHDPFDIIIGGDKVENGKPDPEIFLKAAQCFRQYFQSSHKTQPAYL